MSIMSNDPRNISSNLRFMDPQTLRKYGEMHKNDPYIFPLVFQESQNRQRVYMNQQAQMAQQPQPKVNEQALAQMAPQQPQPSAQPMPEDVGIATLPAPNMTMAAEGGIMGYEGYDEGPSNFGQEPVMMMAGGGHVQGYDRGGAIKAGPEFMRFLKSMNVDLVEFAAMSDEAKSSYMEMFERGKTAPAAAPTSATPTTQTTQTPSKAFAAGQATRPVLDSAGRAVKAGAIPVIGGGLSAAQGLSEVDAAQAFYNDPNVPTAEKVKQFARTGVNVAAPYVGGAIGSGMGPLGTVAGAGIGAGVSALVDDEGAALRKYRAKNEPSKAPSGSDIRSQLNRADAAVYAQPGVDNAPAAAGPSTGAAPSAAPSSVLSSSTLSKTNGGRGGPSANAATGKNSPDIFSPEGIRAAREKFMGKDDYEIDALKNQLVEFNSRANARVEDRLAARQKEINEEGDIYKDRSDRLVARGKRLETQEGQNMGLALLNAGLAIMSTPGSLATAIGKGAQVGTAQYAAGLDKLRAAQERLDDAKERIDELRLNRKDLNAREIRGLEKDRDTALADSERAVFGFAKDVYNLNRSDATKMFDKYMSAQEKVYEQDQATKRTLATIRASTDSRTKQLWAGLMQKHGNDPVAAAREYNTIEAGDKTNVAAEKLVQDRVGEWEKANKLRLSLLKPAEQAAELRSAEQRLRNDIYTQLKLTPTMGAGASGDSRFKLLGVTPTQ
jgi:hypothetical protein